MCTYYAYNYAKHVSVNVHILRVQLSVRLDPSHSRQHVLPSLCNLRHHNESWRHKWWVRANEKSSSTSAQPKSATYMPTIVVESHHSPPAATPQHFQTPKVIYCPPPFATATPSYPIFLLCRCYDTTAGATSSFTLDPYWRGMSSSW
jgi:hypothetical protein